MIIYYLTDGQLYINIVDHQEKRYNVHSEKKLNKVQNYFKWRQR